MRCALPRQLRSRSPVLWIVLACAVAPGFGEEPAVEGLDEAAASEEPITPDERSHWAYRPLHRPEPPAVRNVSRVRNPIDRFILARLESKKLAPLPEADPVTLIRRVTLDLLGLPPTPGEIDGFLEDPSPDAYDRLVDRLLASPAYGARWSQHWLDLARFAETDGFEHDKVRPDAWRYRDWVIQALDEDMPYDQFVRLQIAGDELDPGDRSAAVATGFALCGPDMPDINLKEERRHVFLNDMTATVGSVFLGLQFGCAQCHDHKFDPISQADFYRLRAFFANVDLFRDHPLPTETPGDEDEKPGKGKQAKGRVLRERDSTAPPSHLMIRGSFRRRGPRVRPAFPRVANPRGDRVRPQPMEGRTSGLRSALARWLTRPDHPLATRVIVNRIWQHHFGEGLVKTPSNYGTMGEPPSHPELLDWLATELPRRNWSLKNLHRLILGSATYRRASRATSPFWSPAERAAAGANLERALEVDPGNRLLARQNRRRLEAEAIRDSLLSVAGRLSPRCGGPGVMPPLPREVRKSIRKDHWKVSPDAEDHHRRSIYLFVRRNLRYPFLEVFDRPDTNTSCDRRSRTTIAPQSLALLNSELTMDAARRLAGRALAESGTRLEAAVERAYRLALARRPTHEEMDLAVRFVEELSTKLRDQGRPAKELALPSPEPRDFEPERGAAVTALCLSLFNLSEFIYVD